MVQLSVSVHHEKWINISQLRITIDPRGMAQLRTTQLSHTLWVNGQSQSDRRHSAHHPDIEIRGPLYLPYISGADARVGDPPERSHRTRGSGGAFYFERDSSLWADAVTARHDVGPARTRSNEKD